MGSFAPKAAAWLRRRAENVLACLLGAMFVAFVAQIVFRYFFGLPTGSLYEMTVVAWLWLVLWGSAFVLKESEEIRFDLLYGSVNRYVRRAMAIVGSVALIVLYAASFPATVRYVSFMKVERTDYLHIRLDYLYSIYAIFAFAIIVRYARILWRLVRGKDAEAPDSLDVSSGL
jgi:TRAP-type C4-dicarboxylate transport system permease small subunit